MYIQSLAGNWQFRQALYRTLYCPVQDSAVQYGADAEAWLSAKVPGDVHTDLLTAGQIPDPFVADNEKRVQWVAERDWEYVLTFRAMPDLLAEERIFLVCDGLDTLADVTLNGQPVGRAKNMFRRYRWDITSLLVEGENQLRIFFHSPVAYARARHAEQPLNDVSLAIPGGAHLRKAICQFGWDWGPQLPPTGIWKDIRLEGYSVARLDDVHLRQHHAGGRVTISAGVAVERWAVERADLRAILRVTAPDGKTQKIETTLRSNETTGALEIEVADPQLWWPNGYPSTADGTSALKPGSTVPPSVLGPEDQGCGPVRCGQPLYEVEIALYQGETICDGRSYQMGLRTLELCQEPDEFGTSFTFVVNGVPIFAKGANWIPADSFPTRISDEHLEHLIRSAAQAHMNMLRVWGGGFYEEERFYDLCDRYGILVWQDFIFACRVYPDDEASFENVCAEAVENIRRLRHRASLALWCGNNEMEWGWVEWGWDKPDIQRFKQAYDRMFHHFLPDICAVADPDRSYWPSSPSSDTPFENPNSVQAGDTHNWMVWHGNLPFTAYREHPSRFVSEFGFQSLPPLETIRTYADEADWNMTSYIMEHHQRNEAGNGKIVKYLTDHFRMPKDFELLVYLTQVLQAECVRTGVEYWRRNRRRTSGTLYWQLNDCWPVASWSSLDYFGRWKALHYAARRFYAPVLLSIEDEGTSIGVHVTSDLTEPWHGAVRWSLETLSGEVLEASTETLLVAPLTSTCLCRLDFARSISDDNCRDVVLICELWQADQRIALDVRTFVPNKHLSLTAPALSVDVHREGDQLVFELTAWSLARFVELALTGVDAVFSDNYFDLPVGRTVAVTCPLPEGWTVEQARAALRMRSLHDSFAA